VKAILTTFFVLSLQLSQAQCALAQAPFEDESPVKADLREAIFRYMFETYDYGGSVKFFCIEAERPLPEGFLQRFSGHKVSVVWASNCERSGPMNAIREKKTGKRGLLVAIRSIHLISGGEAQADVEAFSDGIAANTNVLKLVRKTNKWIVKSDKTTGVS
jgi:hypothetical protein